MKVCATMALHNSTVWMLDSNSSKTDTIAVYIQIILALA